MSTAPLPLSTHFELSPDLTYLNYAGIGPPSAVATRRAASVLERQAVLGSRGSAYWQGLQASARHRVARLIGAHDSEIAFTKNTPESISIVASGLRWREGDNVVVPRCEFPANVYPWMNLAARGVEVRWVDAPEGVFTLDDVARAIDERTRIVALSWIQFSSGFRIDLEAVGDLCDDRGVHLLVDAIQGVGVVPIDVKACNVHFLATASHKWLMAPMGAGWFYCRSDVIDGIELTEVGQNTVVPGTSYTSYAFEPKPDARRFEAGVPPYACIAGLDGALELLEQIGVERVHEHVLGLCDRLIEGVQEKGCTVRTPLAHEQRAGIVSFRHPTVDSDTVESTCAVAGVVVASREGAVRVAPHVTNTTHDIDRFLEAL